MFLAHGASAFGRAPVDTALDSEQGRDPLQGFERDRRGGCVMHVEELATNMAPAGDFGQRWIGRRCGGLVKPVEPSDMFCKTYRWICCPRYVIPERCGRGERAADDD
jgi:hypothetical protein